MDKTKQGPKSMSRRDFIKKVGKGAAGAGVATVMAPLLAKSALASEAKRDYILIGAIYPVTGPLAAFGAPGPWVADRAVKQINAHGGIYLKEYGKKFPLKYKLLDSESSPTKAAELASKLVMKDKVDILMPAHTPDTVNPVSAIAERFKVPCICIDAPIEDWLMGGPYHWSFLHFWSAQHDITHVYMGMWDQLDTNKVVGGLWPNDPDGTSWAKFFAEQGPKRGYKIIDQGRFPFFMKDFGAQINAFKEANVEIVTGVLIPPDFATVIRQFHQTGFKPKIITMGKAILFPSAVAALGSDLGEGLTMEIWWSPYHPFKSSLTGETARQFCNAWEKTTGRQWTPPIGYEHSGWELIKDVLTRAGSLDKEMVRSAIAGTNLKTIVGPVKYNAQNYGRTPLVGGQWTKGKKWKWVQNIVFDKGQESIPLTGSLKPMNYL
ncbi:MAG: ABC transporter substrate-binding protein [Desulfatiglandaceae bacterium]